MQRVLRYDGLLPQVLKPTGGTSRSAQRADIGDVRAMRAYITTHRTDPTPFDIVIEGETPGDDRQEAARIVTPWAEAGATWWLEALWDADTQDQVRQRIQQGPLDIA